MKYIFIITLGISLLFISCNKDVQKDINPVEDNKSSVVFVTDNNLLDQRIELINEDVVFEGKSTTGLDYRWVANLLPSTYGNLTLSASSVDGAGDKAYVGWHSRGDSLIGEISVLDVSNPDAPALVQWQMFDGIEFNDVEVRTDKGKIFFAGHAKNDLSYGHIGDNTAMAMSWNVDSEGLISSFNWEEYLYGYSANSITYVPNNTIWVSKGSAGGITVFDNANTSDVKLDHMLSNAKHFDATGDYGVLLYGVGYNKSVIRVWNLWNLYNAYQDFYIPFDVTDLGKNAVDVNFHYVYLAMGNDGVVKVDLRNGMIVNRFDNNNGGFANGVYVDFKYVYVAYGKDGLFILDKQTFEVKGNWNYDGSCNYVKRVGDFLYLANGDKDGLIILKKN